MKNLACWISIAIACVVSVGCGAMPGERSAQPAALNRPNIVVILVDDMGFSDIGAFGSEIATPHIDALAREGVAFTEFYNAARCWPSRAALMSGLYQHQVGLGGDLQYTRADGVVTPSPDDVGAYQGYFSFDVPNLAERLKRVGYRTYATGKWHLGDVDIRSWPTRRGFDHYFGPVTGTDSYFATGIDPARTRKYIEDETEWPVPAEGFYATTAFTDKAVEYIRTDPDAAEPFFLYVAYTAPHWPLHALPADIARHEGAYDAGWDQVREARAARARALGIADARHILPERPSNIPAWETASDRAEWSDRMEVYAAQIDAMDQGVGRIVEALRATGQLDNTLILFLSDNGGTEEDLADRPSTARFNAPGAAMGSRDSFAAYTRNWAFVSNTPYQGYKAAMGEGGIRTPMIAYWPAGVSRPGRLSRQVGHVIDVAPTLLAVAHTGVSAELEGESLLADIEGPSRTRDRTLYFEHMGNRAVRDGDWKAVMDAGGPWRLYNLRADPTERRDLAVRDGRRLGELVALWEDWARRVGVRGLPSAPGSGNVG